MPFLSQPIIFPATAATMPSRPVTPSEFDVLRAATEAARAMIENGEHVRLWLNQVSLDMREPQGKLYIYQVYILTLSCSRCT